MLLEAFRAIATIELPILSERPLWGSRRQSQKAGASEWLVVMLSIAWSLVTVQLATLSRRAVLHSVPICAYAVGAPRAHAASPSLEFLTASSGLQWADAKVGSGPAFQKGQRVAIDYVMSTTGARYGSKIDSTKDRNAPYSWTLGDGSTIIGLEEAILGGEGVLPMLPGGVRRVIVPSKLAYEDLAKPNKNGLQFQDCSTGRGPIPPQEPQSSGDMGAGEFQRFKNICTNPRRSNAPLPCLSPKESVPAHASHVILTPRDMMDDVDADKEVARCIDSRSEDCNANRPYQPDLVLDIKLFGKRS